MTGSIIYLKAEEASYLRSHQVHIGDVASVYCGDRELEEMIRDLHIHTFAKKDKGRAFISVLVLIRAIRERVPGSEVRSIGARDLVVCYKPPDMEVSPHVRNLRILFICLTCFLGSGVSIMEYNYDVELIRIFQNYYRIFTGTEVSGPTFMAFFYSVGLTVGIFLFFNHIPGGKVADEPTPIQVQMRLYERDLNQTFVLDAERNGEELDVDMDHE
ncbi:MAG: stage V sporulation protein AA [Eubacterium sp.]|nr:stage V sporulation protein AA [Eubacterium sp.]